MKRIEQHKLFQAVAVTSFLLLSIFSASTAEASKPKHAPAKQIGFQVIDQPAVVIDGRAQSGHSPVPAGAVAPSAQVPSLAAEPVVEGFGDKVPLTVALQQILPQGYGYTLGDGVNAGQLVSWRGGRPWGDVLQSMLATTGLTYSMNGRSVAINSTGAAPTVVVGTPAPVAIPAPAMPQPVMQQPVMQQPVVQQPVMQQPVMMDQSQVVVQPYAPQPVMQPMMQPMPPVQMMQPQIQSMPQPGVQPLQVENPLIFASQQWEARPGQTLRSILQEWCARVGAELSWSAEFDYPIMASVNVTGTFEEAVRTLLSGFEGAKPTPRGRLHYNPAAGQSILIVEANGNHYGD